MKATSLPRISRHATAVLRRFTKELNLPAATYARILILARQIADWAKSKEVRTSHLLAAIQFCTLEDAAAAPLAPAG